MTRNRKDAALPGTGVRQPKTLTATSTQGVGEGERPSKDFLLTTRATLILVLAVLLGTIVGLLTWWGDHEAAKTALAALGTTGGAIPVLHAIIGP